MAFFPIFQTDLGPWSPWGQFIRLRQAIDELLYAEIAQRQQQADPDREDILSLLLGARDEAGNGMTVEELRDELITLLIAGHETTATAMAWALYWIHRLPPVEQALRAELESLGPNPEPMAIARLPYLNAVCSETLRIYPVAPIVTPRISKQPVTVDGHTFEPGTFLTPCIYLVHHRPDLYPEPDQFQPERFLERTFSPYEYFPFGGSNRRCIGAAFALFEMKLALAKILSQYRLALADETVQPTRRGVTIAPKGGVRLIILEEYPSTIVARTPVGSAG
jgi:unspecific monooxygenase